MKKVGIITFHRSINYGGVLQAYALKHMLNKLGAECSVIDYKNKHIENINKVKLFNLNSIKSFINGILSYLPKKSKYEKFLDFRVKHLNLAEGEINNEIEHKYDLFITGSDQVWNFQLSRFDTVYFLDFVKDSRKKNSYAASFGFSEIPSEYIEKYKKLLSDFSSISIREEQGFNIIQSHLKQDVPVVLDPSLLLDVNDWINNFNITRKSQKDFILLYLMTPDPKLIKLAEKLSKETGFEIIYITDKTIKKLNATYARTVSPIEWVELFMNAKYIVTNSFHGVAFSINFNKNFFMSLLPSTSNVSSRLENIVRMFGLEKRQINNDINDVNLFEDIDFTKVNKILERERNNSIAFLREIINKDL